MRSRLLILFVVLLLHASSLEAGSDKIDYNTARLDRRLPAVRASSPIAVDGNLDEAAWRDAPVAAKFIQSEPKEGEPASEDTDVRILYDDANLYIGVLAHDREPDRIIVNELKKDFSPESADVFEVVLDTFRDERNGYMFATNARGAKWDAQMVNEGRETNPNWDGVWTVRTRIAAEGWYAEIAIPFRTLKFTSANPQTWGINFLRRIRRRNEDSFWSPLPRFYRLPRVSMAGTLEGLQGIRPGANLRVKPYALASSSDVGGASAKGDAEFGVDAKYGVTTGLTWDFTVNTDFSQVEADEQQINLTRFSLFFPEKRDFFLENSGIFQFGPGNMAAQMEAGGAGGVGGGPAGGGGGRQNTQLNDIILFFSRHIGLSENGDAIPILAGSRLTGRARAYTIGALTIQQRRQGDSPSTNFTALRLRRNILNNSDVGLMVLNKYEDGGRYNRVLGADANFRFFSNLNLNGFAAKTFSPDAVAGGTDEDLTTRVGMSWRNDFWEARGSYLTIGEGFNDEMGFVPRLGINKTDLYFGVHLRPEKTAGWLREISPHWQFADVERRSGGLDSRYYDYHVPLRLQNGTLIEAGTNPTIEELVAPFEINSRRGITIAPGRYQFNEYFVLWRTDQSARLSLNGRYGIGDFYDGYKHAYQFGATTRMSERLNVSANVSTNVISLPGGAYTTNLLSGRVNYSFSTRMFLNAFLQYNTDAQQWSSNIRFNIIHRPLSDFFIVYNERRDSRSGDLLNRALVAKMTYMIAF